MMCGVGSMANHLSRHSRSSTVRIDQGTGWKREWERVIVCPWLQSGVGFMASSPSFLFWSLFPHSFFVSLHHFSIPTCRSFPFSSLSSLSDPPSLPFNLLSPLPSLFYLLCPHSRPLNLWNLLHTNQCVYMQQKWWFSKLYAPQFIIGNNSSNDSMN